MTNIEISIITVVFNGEKYLTQTIESVIRQNCKNIEYIVIDGGSTDGTIDIIKQYEAHIDYWISEKDNGIYDAMNKGLQAARGKYVAFINADDWYEEGALQKVCDILQKEDLDLLTTGVRVVDENGRPIVIRKSELKEYGKNIHHQTCFFKRELHLMYPYDTRYKIAADRDLLVKLIKKGIHARHEDIVTVNFREGGAGADLLRYQKELFVSNLRNIGFGFALKRYLINVGARTFFNSFKIKR